MGEARREWPRPLVAASTGALALLALDVWSGGPLDRLERRVVGPPAAGPGLWPTLTILGDRASLAGMTAAAAGIALVRRVDPTEVLLPVAVGVPLRIALMWAVDRSRPPRERWLVPAADASFPSRHTTGAALGLLALRRALPTSGAVDLSCATLIAAEGYSRVRLGVHWPTDVAGGVLLALAVDGLGSPCSGRGWSGRHAGAVEAGSVAAARQVRR